MPEEYSIPPPSSSDAIRAQKMAQAQAAGQRAVRQEAAQEEFEEWSELSAFNPLAMSRRFEKLDKKVKTRSSSSEESDQTGNKDKKIEQVKKSEESATRFQQRNPEFEKKDLLDLRARIKDTDTPEEILKKVLETYPDFTLADESLDFLLETSDGELARNILAAKEQLNRLYGKEIRAGKNIQKDVQAFSQQGLGAPTTLRGLYSELINNPREPATLFEEFAQKYPFEEQINLIAFFLHALGTDMKSKGPSIDKAELIRLMTQMRSVQGIWGLYRFFRSRIKMLQEAFQKNGLVFPERITFDLLARQLVKYLQERYPSPDKLKQLAGQLGISKEIIAQILLLSTYRDAMRQISPLLFRSDQHRQDALKTILDTLEMLEDDLDEAEEDKNIEGGK